MKFDRSKSSPRRRLSLLAVPLTLVLLAAATAGAQTPPATASRTGPLSGYMELHLNKVERQDAVLDFHRFVLLFNHQFSPKIRFVGELELEHAFVEGLEEGGEVELEQAYLDFLIDRRFNVRAGMMLVPVGIINERHEPPVFNGVERPLVDTVIVPTTWFEAGAGVHGDVGNGFRYRAYVMAPLDALGFSADEGIRGGPQHGAEARARNAAFTGRLEYTGLANLTLGASAWVGKGNADDSRLDTPVKVREVDARYATDRLELRAQFADVAIDRAGAINDTLARLTGIDPNIARGLRGYYTEAAYRVWAKGAPRDLVAFVRYERANTQHRMPAGWLPLEEHNRRQWVAGLTYYPEPDIAVKVDYVWLRNRSGVIRSPSSFNVGLGWWF
jgi:hypothetical protein